METLTNVSLDPGAEQSPDLIDPVNYAYDPVVVDRVREELLAIVPQVRNDRLPHADRWDRYRKMWNGEHTKKLYGSDGSGVSSLYLSSGYKIAETFVAHIKSQLFPGIDSFNIEANDPISYSQMPLIRMLIKHDVQEAKIERHVDTTLRNLVVEGTSVVKNVWKTISHRNYTRSPITLPSMDPQTINFMSGFNSKIVTQEGPTYQNIRNLDFFVHPITCNDISEADFTMEDIAVDRSFLIQMARAQVYLNVDQLLAQGQNSGQIKMDTAASKDIQNSRMGVTEQQTAKALPNRYIISEFYARFDLYGTGETCWTKITTCNHEVLEVRQSPFFDQEPPYHVAKFIDLPGLFWGRGVMEPIEHLNIASNAMFNQFIDALRYQVNHIIGVDVSRLGQDLSTLRIAPRAMWQALGNPAEVFVPIRPPDNTQVAIMGLQLLGGLQQDIAGAPSVIQGKFSNTEKTAREVSQVAAGAMTAINGSVRNVEVQIMTPWIRRAYIREQQFRAIESEALITGGSLPLKIPPTALVGSYGMRWQVGTQVNPLVAQGQQVQDAAQQGGPPAPGGPLNGPAQPPPTADGLGTQPNLGV